MAIWQYTFELIPRAKLIKLFGDVPQTIDADDYEQVEWWSDGTNLTADFENRLASFAASYKSWSADVKCWGAEDCNVVQVIMDGGRVVELSVRFDLRKLDETFLHNMVGFARDNECVFLTESMRVIEPSADVLKAVLMSSDAWRFVEDPRRYLEELNKNRQVLHTA